MLLCTIATWLQSCSQTDNRMKKVAILNNAREVVVVKMQVVENPVWTSNQILTVITSQAKCALTSQNGDGAPSV